MDMWDEYEAKVGTLFSETSSIVTKEQGLRAYKAVCWISSVHGSIIKSEAVLSS